jgi:limonene-1,2-epoxide hydrolase
MPDRTQLFDDIDSMEPERFTAHLAEDVTMRFGNAEPIHGREAAHEAWAGFCEGIDGVSHDVIEQWEQGGATIVESTVTYTRKDGTTISLPVVTIYRGEGDLIDDYRIFIDLAPLFADAG